MTITATLPIAPGKVQPVNLTIIGNFDMTTDAIAKCKTMSDIKLLEAAGLLKINN